MDHEIFIHRQTTAQAVRFTTTELADMERIWPAPPTVPDSELEIFTLLRSAVLSWHRNWGTRRGRLLKLMCHCIAQLASSNHYCRPQIRNEPVFKITKGGIR